jgi:predicted RNA-binding Zn-ribbon protein involved in translation (DUF1610 family)
MNSKKDNRIKFCTSCGEKVIDSTKECTNCGKNPVGGSNDFVTEEDSGLTFEEQFFENRKYCINCGDKIKGEKEENYIKCTNCGINPCGSGKYFREEITINYCENCGNDVSDRDEVCTCGRLPYCDDNKNSDWDMNEVERMSEKEFDEFIEKDSEKESQFKVLFCKECGFNHNDDEKYHEIDEEWGDVYYKCPKCNYGDRNN